MQLAAPGQILDPAPFRPGGHVDAAVATYFRLYDATGDRAISLDLEAQRYHLQQRLTGGVLIVTDTYDSRPLLTQADGDGDGTVVASDLASALAKYATDQGVIDAAGLERLGRDGLLERHVRRESHGW